MENEGETEKINKSLVRWTQVWVYLKKNYTKKIKAKNNRESTQDPDPIWSIHSSKGKKGKRKLEQNILNTNKLGYCLPPYETQGEVFSTHLAQTRIIIILTIQTSNDTNNFLLCMIRNLEVDGCPSKENLFRQSALLMNTAYIVFS